MMAAAKLKTMALRGIEENTSHKMISIARRELGKYKYQQIEHVTKHQSATCLIIESDIICVT
jgi:hypothetical protein